MSHFDDIEPVLWSSGGGGAGWAGFAAFVVLSAVAVAWACYADEDAALKCQEHGERYIDSRAEYTLCEQDGGTVVRR